MMGSTVCVIGEQPCDSHQLPSSFFFSVIKQKSHFVFLSQVYSGFLILFAVARLLVFFLSLASINLDNGLRMVAYFCHKIACIVLFTFFVSTTAESHFIINHLSEYQRRNTHIHYH